MEKFLISFPILDPQSADLRILMEKIASVTGIALPFWRLNPQLFFHRPLTLPGISEDLLKRLIGSAIMPMRKTAITIHGLYSFGKESLVIPAQATRNTVPLWTGIEGLLSSLPGYERNEYAGDNMLYIPVAVKTSSVFDRAWPKIQKMMIEPLTIPVRTIALHKKFVANGAWKKVVEFPLQVA